MVYADDITGTEKTAGLVVIVVVEHDPKLEDFPDVKKLLFILKVSYMSREGRHIEEET